MKTIESPGAAADEIGRQRLFLAAWIADLKAGRDVDVGRLERVFDGLGDLRDSLRRTAWTQSQGEDDA